jgi:NADP-dependent 3-hydroxy acid dehydrogenase YdfG
MPFPYKTILVVGATSGIGLALSEKFIGNGCHVIAVGRRQQNLDSFVQKHGKDKASSFQFDITNLSAIPDFVKSFVHHLFPQASTSADQVFQSHKSPSKS